MKCRTIVFTEREKAELIETDFEQINPEPGFALLKTEYTLISPGTERACLLGLVDGSFPMTLGYSAVATVLEAGKGSDLKPGDRAVIYHSHHSSLQLKEERDIVRIENPAIDSRDAVFAVTAAMGLQGIRKVRPELGESVAVMGLGLLGLAAVRCAHLSGAFPLIALDFNKKRRAIAKEFGAGFVFSPDEPELKRKIQDLTHGGINALIEVTGNPDALNSALDFMAPLGRIALVGCSRLPTEQIDFYHKVHKPGISIIGAHNFVRPRNDSHPGYCTMRDDMRTLLRLTAAGKFKPSAMQSEIAKPEDAPEIFRRLVKGDPDMLGVLFDWRDVK